MLFVSYNYLLKPLLPFLHPAFAILSPCICLIFPCFLWLFSSFYPPFPLPFALTIVRQRYINHLKNLIFFVFVR